MLLAPEIIDTTRLVLRRPKVIDAAAVYEYGRDPEVTRYLDWPTHSDIRDAIAATEAALQRWESGAEFTWRIAVKPWDDPIGAIACRVRGHAADIGFVLARKYWGHGYATEAARGILEWASSTEDIYRVWATCDVDNLASARVLEKMGMSREGILRRWLLRPNLGSRIPRDAFVYAWVRES